MFGSEAVARGVWAGVLVWLLAACAAPPPLRVRCTRDQDCTIGLVCDTASGACVAPRPDAGPAPSDGGPPDDAARTACEAPRTCASDTECSVGVCLEASSTLIGGPIGVVGLPAGIAAPRVSIAPGGLCVARDSCTLGAGLGRGDGCGACQRCVPTLAGPACRPRCGSDEDCAFHVGYVCDASLGACIEGCASDTECRIARVDHGTIGAFDGPGTDPLEYDAASTATCEAGRCVRSGGATVSAGAPCSVESACADAQTCITPVRGEGDPHGAFCAGLDCARFVGGYCASLGCADGTTRCGAGEACIRIPAPGVIGTSDGSTSFCARTCMPGAEPEADRIGLTGHGLGCEVGQACVPERDTQTGAAVGACLPGRYDDLTTPNVGTRCTRDATCWSPFGLGRCDSIDPRAPGAPGLRACTIEGCSALPPDACGAGAACQLVRGGDLSLCLATCASAADCTSGLACADADDDPSTPRVCFGGCGQDADCRADEFCRGATLSGPGRCLRVGTCDEPLDAFSAGTLEDGWLIVDGCRGVVPITSSAPCFGADSASSTYEWMADATGTLLIDGQPRMAQQIAILGTECGPSAQTICTPPLPTTFPITNGKRGLVRAGLMASLGWCERIGASASLRVRVAEAVALSERCDLLGVTSRCATGACVDRDGTGARCVATPPACDSPVLLSAAGFLRADASFAYLTSLTNLATTATCTDPMFPGPMAPTLWLRFTAPADGTLTLRSSLPSDGRAGIDPILSLASPSSLATFTAACGTASACSATTTRHLTSGESLDVALPVIGAGGLATDLNYVGAVAHFAPDLAVGAACDRTTGGCPPATACADPSGLEATTCVAVAIEGAACDPRTLSSCASGLDCVGSAPGAMCIHTTGTGTCSSPYDFGALSHSDPSGWLVHAGLRAGALPTPGMFAPCTAMPPSPYVVYSWTAPAGGALVARTDLFGGYGDTILVITPSCSGPLGLACNDDINPAAAQLESRVAAEVTSGQPIQLVVGGYPSAPSAYTLSVRILPARHSGEACDPSYQTNACVGSICDPLMATCR